jgi:hypothetical protein
VTNKRRTRSYRQKLDAWNCNKYKKRDRKNSNTSSTSSNNNNNINNNDSNSNNNVSNENGTMASSSSLGDQHPGQAFYDQSSPTIDQGMSLPPNQSQTIAVDDVWQQNRMHGR